MDCMIRKIGKLISVVVMIGTCLTLFTLSSDAETVRAAKAKPAKFPAIELTENDPYWKSSWKEVYKTVPELIMQHQSEMQKNIRRDKLMHGDLTKKQIAITFDDGPHPKYTPKLLSILKANHVKATFFLVGMLAEKYPKLVRAESRAGHSIGDHTYHHVNLTQIPSAYVATEIDACGDVLKKITGRRTHLFRPPGGDYNDQVAEVASALNYKIILWTDDPGDYSSPGEAVIMNRIMDKVTNGGIILIHDGIQQTIDILPKVISNLRKKGYEFVTIDEMLETAKHSQSKSQQFGSNEFISFGLAEPHRVATSNFDPNM